MFIYVGVYHYLDMCSNKYLFCSNGKDICDVQEQGGLHYFYSGSYYKCFPIIDLAIKSRK